MSDRRCPEGVIVDGAVIHCGRDGGHEGNHVGVTDTGIAEWPRIAGLGLIVGDEVPF